MKLQNKLYLLERNDNVDYDQYDSFVVCAKSEEEARELVKDTDDDGWIHRTVWVPDDVTATCIGVALDETEHGVVLGSFCAG